MVFGGKFMPVPRVMFGVALWKGKGDQLIKKIKEGMAISGTLYALGEQFIEYHPNEEIHFFGCVFKRASDSVNGEKPEKLNLDDMYLNPEVRAQWIDSVHNLFAQIGVSECKPMMILLSDV